MLKTEVEGRGFQHLPRDLANVNALKNHVWSLLLHKSENICYISHYFLHYIVSPFLWCLAKVISTNYDHHPIQNVVLKYRRWNNQNKSSWNSYENNLRKWNSEKNLGYYMHNLLLNLVFLHGTQLFVEKKKKIISFWCFKSTIQQFLSHMVIMEGSQLKALFNIAPYSHQMNSTLNPEPCNPKLCMLTTPSPGHIVKYGNKIIKQEIPLKAMLRLWGSEVDTNLQSWWTMKYRSRSNMNTAVIPKCKLIPSIITVAFIVFGKWTWTLRSKLGWLKCWQIDRRTDKRISCQAKSRRDNKTNCNSYKNKIRKSIPQRIQDIIFKAWLLMFQNSIF